MQRETAPFSKENAQKDLNPTKGLQPVDHPESLKQIAYKSLHRALITSELKPGEIYKEKDLAKMLNISRTPVREALLELAAKGLVTFLPRKGVQITEFDLHDLNEIFELRMALELLAIEKVARAIGDEELTKLQNLLNEQKRCAAQDNYLDFLQYDRYFHTLISELTRNKRLVSTLGGTRDLIQLMGAHALSAQGRLEEVIQEHGAIIQALSEKDPAIARRNMEFHLEKTRQKSKSILFPDSE